MSTKSSCTKYTEEFKKTIVSPYQNGKTYSQIQKEYGVSSSALSNWVRYSRSGPGRIFLPAGEAELGFVGLVHVAHLNGFTFQKVALDAEQAADIQQLFA